MTTTLYGRARIAANVFTHPRSEYLKRTERKVERSGAEWQHKHEKDKQSHLHLAELLLLYFLNQDADNNRVRYIYQKIV
jgi:hypothetical protein